jgi:hypothetical protein
LSRNIRHQSLGLERCRYNPPAFFLASNCAYVLARSAM